MNTDLIKSIPGPILVIGASGFIGSNLIRKLLSLRNDAFGIFYSSSTWRLQGLPTSKFMYFDLADPIAVKGIMEQFGPKVIFDCSAFGAYSFEQDYGRIHRTNYLGFIQLQEILLDYELVAYVHAGSSSEYGLNAAGPSEDSILKPNSHYAISKAAVSQAIQYYGKIKNTPISNLRLYSVYGPYEDSSRLIPVLCEKVNQGLLPSFATGETSRDFIHINDVINAFFAAAIQMSPQIAGESFNIGTGRQISLIELAQMAVDIFKLKVQPVFSSVENRVWDVPHWYSDPSKAAEMLDWHASISLEEGLSNTAFWWREFAKEKDFNSLTKKNSQVRTKNSISAIIACYRDESAIPIMYE